jgi:hypothetical protein
MTKNHKFLMLLAVVVLIGAGGVTGLATSPKGSAQSDAPVIESATLGAVQGSACSVDAQQAFSSGSTQVKPGCCSTQCNVDRDCDKICGKGNCACIQENPCCRRCVY